MADSSTPKKKKRVASLMRFFGKAGEKSDTESCSGEVQSTTVETGCQESPVPPSADAGAVVGAMPKPSLVSFKYGRIALVEKKLHVERHPSVVAAMFGFHQLVSQLKQESGHALPLTSIPNDHLPLVAMLVQEQDVTMASLVKSIESLLCPVLFGEESMRKSDILAPGVVEGTVSQLAEQRNYGVELGDLHQLDDGNIPEVPQNLSIQRWEVKDPQLLPGDMRDVMLKRRSQREEARAECAQWFCSLDNVTRAQLLAGTLKKLKNRRPHNTTPQGPNAGGGSAHDGRGTTKSTAPASPQKTQNTLRGQRSLQKFFTAEKHHLSSSPSETETKGYYRTTFLPFNVRRNTRLCRYQIPEHFDPGRIDELLYPSAMDSGGPGGQPLAADLLRGLARPQVSAPQRPPPVHTAIGGVDIDEAELHLMRLRQMPMKMIQFDGGRRPGYFGTWSRRLQHVSGRRPFAQDPAVLDYAADSDAEWEADDEEGEELRSDDDDDEEEEDDDDEDDEDFDEEGGFVVGDGEVLSRDHGHLAMDVDGGSDESEFNSEDEEIEEIDPDEEVCDDRMDIDQVEVVETTAPAPVSPKRPVQSKTKRSHKPSQPRQRRKVVPLTPVVVGLLMSDPAPRMDVSGHGSDPISANDDESAHCLLARLAVSSIGAAMPLHISVDSAAMWAPQKGPDATGSTATGEGSEPSGMRKDKAITDSDMSALVSVVHGSSFGVARLVDELKRQIPTATKAQIERLIHEHASKEKRPPATRSLWYVSSDLVTKFQSAKLSDPIEPDTPSSSTGPSAPSINLMLENVAKRQRTDGVEPI